MRCHNLYLHASVVPILATFALAGPAMAQEVPEAGASDQGAVEPDTNIITVTAQRRSEQSVDVPITITTLDSEALATANVVSLSDTVKLTPALRFDSQGPAVQPTIRGVGTAITTSGGGPNVGIYVDGFFQANTYVNDFQLTNVESIQVLKGPQGTLFGRNTTGGAILVSTAEPSFTPGAEFSLGYSRFNTVRGQAYVTAPIADVVAFDLEGIYEQSDGFQTDTLTGNAKIGKSDSWTVRAGILVEPSSDWSILFRYIHSKSSDPMSQLVNAYVDERGDADFFGQVSAAGQAIYGQSSSQGLPLVYFYAPDGTFTTAPGQIALNDPLSFQTESDIVQMTVQADLGFAELTSYSQYRADKTPYFGDLDVTTLPFFQINVPVDDETVSQELLLNSKPGGRLQWTAGINYFRIRDTWDVNASFGTPFFDFGGSSTTTTSYAAFVDATYEVIDHLFLTAGARYSSDNVSDAYFTINPAITSYTGPDGNPVPLGNFVPGDQVPVDDLENNSLTPRFVIRYETTDDSSVYASYTRGYKAGILNVGGLSQQPVEPEEIDAFEVGFKFDNGTISFDTAGFYYDYANLQVSSFQNGAAQIRNAASAEIYGIEAQTRFRPTSNFTIYGGAAWTKAQYKSFENAPFYSYCDPVATSGTMACGAIGAGSLTQTIVDASGFTMQRAPEFTANLGASYGVDVAAGRLTLSGNVYHTSEVFFDPSEQFRQGSYQLVSLRAEWLDPSETFSVAAYADNVTGERYLTQVLFNTLGIGSVWSAPVTYGVEVGVSF